MTLPSWGFSWAVPGRTIPEAVTCSASTVWTTIRSSSGLMEIDIADLPFSLVGVMTLSAALDARCAAVAGAGKRS